MREQYEAAVGKIASRHRVQPSGSYEIPPDATKDDCIAYTLHHVCGQHSDGTQANPHYRYHRYRHALHDSLVSLKASVHGPHRLQIAVDEMVPGAAGPPGIAESEDATGKSVRLVALDLGSGPGIFSWVAHDYLLESRNVDLKLFALDRCSNMVSLARALWRRMDTRCDLTVASDWRRIRTDVSSAVRCQGRESTMIVTLGHLLVQIVSDSRSIRQIAHTLADCVSFCAGSVPPTRCVVIGADAHSGIRRELFERAWRRLRQTLADAHGVSLSSTRLDRLSQMCGEAALDRAAGDRRA